MIIFFSYLRWVKWYSMMFVVSPFVDWTRWYFSKGIFVCCWVSIEMCILLTMNSNNGSKVNNDWIKFMWFFSSRKNKKRKISFGLNRFRCRWSYLDFDTHCFKNILLTPLNLVSFRRLLLSFNLSDTSIRLTIRTYWICFRFLVGGITFEISSLRTSWNCK